MKTHSWEGVCVFSAGVRLSRWHRPCYLGLSCSWSACRARVGCRQRYGAAALCLLFRLPLEHISGVEWNAAYVALSRNSMKVNGYSAVSTMICADLREKHQDIPGSVFDVVVTNPPYHTTGTRSHDSGRSAAHMEGVPLKQWIDFCLRCLRPGGTFVIIHRADRLEALLHALRGRAGAIEIISLWPRAGVDAKRVIIRAKKGSTSPVRVGFGLVLHASSGSGFTTAAQMILREGKSLDEALASQGFLIGNYPQ